MSSLTSVIDVARDGLLAQTIGLDVTGQNISNVNTPGYAQRTADLETTTSNGAFGSVQVSSIDRADDSFAEGSVITETGKENAAQARSAALANAQSILAPSGGPTIADQASAFFSSMTSLAENPSDPATRASTLDAATQLAQTISGTATQLAQQSQELLGQAQGVAGQLNQELGTIASLNTQIASAKAGGNEPADLEDQRDALVTQVGQGIDLQVIQQPSGAVTLLSSGAALVDDGRASTIAVAPDDAGKLSITVHDPGGGSTDVTGGVTSGTLGGLREARDVDLAGTQTQLDQYASDLTTNVNALQTTGYGLDGQTGRPLFQPQAGVAGAARAMAVSQAVAGDPSALAATSDPGGLPGGNDLALSMAQLASQPQGAASSPALAFASITSTLGTAKQDADAEVTLRTSTVAQAQNLLASGSGVSLDEEMVKLSSYQQAFEASQQVLQTADSLLNGLIQAL